MLLGFMYVAKLSVTELISANSVRISPTYPECCAGVSFTGLLVCVVLRGANDAVVCGASVAVCYWADLTAYLCVEIWGVS